MDTILVVDDEKNYPLVLSAVLQEEGFETLTANSGEEALDIIDHSDVDLVLTDMKMPKMDGIELLERIKLKDAELPVIMMTAHGTVEKHSWPGPAFLSTLQEAVPTSTIVSSMIRS